MGAVWGAVIDAGMQLGSAAMSQSSNAQTNRTNIKLQRQQQGWEEMMSNTAVQRRVKDIAAAGGNPATAFVNGGEATTPTVAPAHVEPTKYDVRTNFQGALFQKAQMDNIKADTTAKLADARSKVVDADIAEQTAKLKTYATANQFIEAVEQQDLKTQLMRNEQVSTAVEAKNKEAMVDAMVKQAQIDAQKGAIDLQALKNIAQMYGVEGGKLQGVMNLVISTILRIAGK